MGQPDRGDILVYVDDSDHAHRLPDRETLEPGCGIGDEDTDWRTIRAFRWSGELCTRSGCFPDEDD